MLFLLAVVLPCTVLIVLTWRVIGQQTELNEKRQADERHRVAREMGQKLLVRLEEIKLHEVSGAAGRTKSLNRLTYTSPEVLLLALTDSNRLWLPWEIEPGTDRIDLFQSNSDIAEKIRRAEQEEFVHQRWAQARKLYLECLDQATHPGQQVYVRLLLARLLNKSGSRDSSLAEYRNILEVDPEITDEHGIPFCLYAMGPLIEQRDSFAEMIDVLNSVLNIDRWFSPAKAYMIQDVVNELLESSSKIESLRENVNGLRENILKRIHNQERALSFQQDFPRLTLMPQWNTSQEENKSIWLPHGQEPLLVSLAPVVQGERRLLIAVQGQDILNAIITGAPYAQANLANPAFNMDADLNGETLGSSFPGLNIVFSDEVGGAPWEDGNLLQSFYLVALLVVLFVVLFGSYFLWRDVTRELRMAEMRSQFIASVSHELKTPLTAIRIFAETLGLERPLNAETKSEYLDTIVHESHRLTRLLNNVLDFSKIEKGSRAYHKELTPMDDIVRAAADTMQYPLMQRDFHLKVHIEENLPPIFADRDAIEQALLNLLSNAMKFSGEAREIDLNAYQKDDHIVLEVKDQGIGIEPAEQERIFEKFHRVAGKENERIPGTGLGLALVAHITEAHGGRIEVQSRPGEGSIFSLFIPLEKNHASHSRC